MQTQNCPNCNTALNLEIGIEGETRSPLSGNNAVCTQCAYLLKFNDALQFEIVEKTEIETMALQQPSYYRNVVKTQSFIAVGNGQPIHQAYTD